MMQRRILKAAGVVALAVAVSACWRTRHLLRGSLYALADLRYSRQAGRPAVVPVEARLVAHAGGAVRGVPYTNSREALDEHYAAGYRVFELDFAWTRDKRLVLVHDWNSACDDFGVRRHTLSYAEYRDARRRDGLHAMTFEDLAWWLRGHRDALVVTDTKEDNRLLLDYLGSNARDLTPQLIVQIYRMSELAAARQLGARAVWLTAYKYAVPLWAMREDTGVDAFVIPVEEYDRYRDPSLMAKTHFYVHSVAADLVNDTFRRLPGIYGIYVN